MLQNLLYEQNRLYSLSTSIKILFCAVEQLHAVRPHNWYKGVLAVASPTEGARMGIQEETVEAYEPPTVVELGTFVQLTNGTAGNDKADDTQYWE